MNNVIEVLKKQKEEQKKQLSHLKFEFDNTVDCLQEELFKETALYNQVLKNNLIDIIRMIHESGLKCSSVSNAETIWHDTVYKISDGCYFVNIVAKDGTITMNTDGIDNDGSIDKLYERVEYLINAYLIPYCEKNKNKYREK
mgnify:CR=1 FL=1